MFKVITIFYKQIHSHSKDLKMKANTRCVERPGLDCPANSKHGMKRATYRADLSFESENLVLKILLKVAGCHGSKI